MTEIETLTAEIVEWANINIPNRTPQSAFLKLFAEIGEIIESPNDPSEYADVCIMLFDLAHMHRVDLSKAIKDKIEVNKRRSWEIDSMGVCKHKKTIGRIDPIGQNGNEGDHYAYLEGQKDANDGKPFDQFKYTYVSHQDWYARGYAMGGPIDA